MPVIWPNDILKVRILEGNISQGADFIYARWCKYVVMMFISLYTVLFDVYIHHITFCGIIAC